MQIFLIRHADALPLDDTMAGDEERPLSEEGQRQLARLAAAFRRLDVFPDAVLTSPLLRAKQTADGLAGHLRQESLEVRECPELAPGLVPKKLCRFLRGLELQHVALVGHEPDLGRLTGYLIGGKRAQIEFAKAGMACVVSDDPPRKATGSLLWMLTPMWLDS